MLVRKEWQNDGEKITKITDNDNDNDNEKDIYRCFAHLSMSLDQFNKLEAEYDKSVIDSCLDSIENFKNNNKYKSLYLTCKNWLKKEPKKVEDKLVAQAKKHGYVK